MLNRQLLVAISALIGVFCLYLIGSGAYISQTSGLLKVQSGDRNALLTVSQENHNAKIIGTGEQAVHLKPGSYQVAAIDNGRQQFATITIFKKQTTNISLNNLVNSMLPSTAIINFEGMSFLTSNGISTFQLSLLKRAFFHFKPLAQTVVIDASSIESVPHDPNTSVGFRLNFTVAIDSIPYKATLGFIGQNDIHLILRTWPAGATVYDSGVIQQ